MNDVPVAANDILGASPPELGEVLRERIHAAVLGGLALLARGSRRQVERHHVDAAELHFEIPTFRVELVVAITAYDFLRFVPCIDRDAAVAFFLGVLVIAVIAGRRE